MAFIFLDESGQFSNNDPYGNYFIVGGFSLDLPRETDKAFRSWRATYFPKRMRRQSEIKWSSTAINDSLRTRILKKISTLDIQINYVCLLKRDIPAIYWNDDKLNQGLLYTNIVAELLETFLPIEDNVFQVFCDKRHLSSITEEKFEYILRNHLQIKLPKGTIFTIKMIDSSTSGNIQIADWIVGAISRYIEKNPHGKEFFGVLKKIGYIEGKRLFT